MDAGAAADVACWVVTAVEADDGAVNVVGAVATGFSDEMGVGVVGKFVFIGYDRAVALYGIVCVYGYEYEL